MKAYWRIWGPDGRRWIKTNDHWASEEDLSKAFKNRKGKDCVRLLSDLRRRTRTTVALTDKIDKVDIGTNKNRNCFRSIHLPR